MHVPRMLWTYWQTRHRYFDNREALETWQRSRLQDFIERRLRHSPYFAPYLNAPLHTWPTMNKATMMQSFDQMNTARLKLDELLACALQAERTRDFSPVVDGYSVGLSSGTSGSRAVFVVSPAERATWAGVMLGRLLPRGLFAGERVALFLRANNNLYTTVRNPWVSFEFFDLLTPLEEHFKRLGRYAPTIVVGPAQLLRSLALAKQEGRIDVHPRKVISGAEVLESFDRALLKQVFGDVGEVYQATEGFLASTCPHGTLHLNEAHVHVEPQWIDATRFVPVITDFSRVTQPIVRYRLDDILVKDAAPCRCGSHEMALERIEGRCDDMLLLPGTGGQTIDVFADGLSRAIAQTLPLTADYRLIQTADATLELYVDAPAAQMPLYRTHLNDYLQRQGVATSAIHWTLHASMPKTGIDTKRRRIVRRPAVHTC